MPVTGDAEMAASLSLINDGHRPEPEGEAAMAVLGVVPGEEHSAVVRGVVDAAEATRKPGVPQGLICASENRLSHQRSADQRNRGAKETG